MADVVQVVGPSAGAEGTIAPMLPPISPRLVPVEPSRDISRSLAPRPPQADTSSSFEPMEPMDSMDSMVGRVGGWGRRVAWTLGTLAVAGLVAAVMLGKPAETSAESSRALADAAVQAPARPQTPASSRASAPRAAAEPALAAADASAAQAAGPEQSGAVEPAAKIDHDDDALVHDALMHRKIRALDILLVSPEATRTIKGRRTARVLHTHWVGAQAHCEGLEIDGVAGWRLPTAGEFRTLGTSNMLGRRIYWSATEGDAFGSDRIVWNNQKKRMAPAPSTWKGGRVLCVRFQHPERVSPS
jgi:hypothetical protein